MPSGAVFIWGGVTVASVPSGWLICDGSLVSATTYANLFAVIGNSYTKYPNTPVAGSFYLPDLTYAIPQNPPTPTYAATITVQTFQGTLINYPGLLDTNCLWQITGFPTNTLNIGTVFPKAQIPGAAYDIYISDIVALQSSGDTFSPPFIVKVIYAPPGTAVLPLIASNISITSAGALTNPASTYWKPGTYNIASDGNPNPWSSPPVYNLYNQLNPAQIPEHQHYMAAPSSGTPPPGPGAINSGTVQPYFAVSTPTSAQTNAFGISTNITLYQPLLYPTMPNIINMFYIIKT
jgi:microcystin-dependent protein